MTDFGDGGDGYCDGDPTDIDWDAVERLAQLQALVLELPPEEQPLANLGVLMAMHGDDLEVL